MADDNISSSGNVEARAPGAVLTPVVRALVDGDENTAANLGIENAGRGSGVIYPAQQQRPSIDEVART